MEELIKEASFVYSGEFEFLVQQCIRALEGSTYETRCAIAPLLGHLVAGTQKRKPTGTGASALQGLVFSFFLIPYLTKNKDELF